LTKLFGKGDKKFTFPKSIYAVMDCINIALNQNHSGITLDYFGGSGTTGHAVINLNREDEGNRKYILVEMGDYFETVTKPRIQKVIYSEDWKDGKPVSRMGISHCMKYIRLEQYEDTLNNLIVKDESKLWTGDEQFNNSYMLGYMLDTETQDSLFNLKWFENPFEVSLKVTRNNEMKEQKIDMVDTFNYLIGLNVASISYPKKGICTVEGVTRRGEKTLVIWRDCTKVDNAALESFFSKSAYSTKGDEFDRIYINGDNNLENLRTSEEHWKVVLTEEEFSKRMFEE
jgi:adenine-specific DNA-methyltransferase